MPLSTDDSARISFRVRALLQAYDAGNYRSVIHDGETFESSLTVEDWDDIDFVYLKLILYCTYKRLGESGDAEASAKAAPRRQEMLDHNANPECMPLSFERESS
jgi:hypothetical protein